MTQDRFFYDHFNFPHYILFYARGWYCSKRDKWMFYSRCLSWRQTFSACCYLVIRQCRRPWWMFTQSSRLLNTFMYPECDGCPINLYVYDKTDISIQQLGWVYSSNSLLPLRWIWGVCFANLETQLWNIIWNNDSLTRLTKLIIENDLYLWLGDVRECLLNTKTKQNQTTWRYIWK